MIVISVTIMVPRNTSIFKESSICFSFFIINLVGVVE